MRPSPARHSQGSEQKLRQESCPGWSSEQCCLQALPLVQPAPPRCFGAGWACHWNGKFVERSWSGEVFAIETCGPQNQGQKTGSQAPDSDRRSKCDRFVDGNLSPRYNAARSSHPSRTTVGSQWKMRHVQSQMDQISFQLCEARRKQCRNTLNVVWFVFMQSAKVPWPEVVQQTRTPISCCTWSFLYSPCRRAPPWDSLTRLASLDRDPRSTIEVQKSFLARQAQQLAVPSTDLSRIWSFWALPRMRGNHRVPAVSQHLAQWRVHGTTTRQTRGCPVSGGRLPAWLVIDFRDTLGAGKRALKN